jgi:hypothetical protein
VRIGHPEAGRVRVQALTPVCCIKGVGRQLFTQNRPLKREVQAEEVLNDANKEHSIAQKKHLSLQLREAVAGPEG